MTRPHARALEQVRTDPDPRLRVVEPVTWGTRFLVVLLTLLAAGIGGVAVGLLCPWLCRCACGF